MSAATAYSETTDWAIEMETGGCDSIVAVNFVGYKAAGVYDECRLIRQSAQKYYGIFN